MKFGAVLPQTELGKDPIALRDYAQGVEELGFDYILCYEHILGADRLAYPEQSFLYDYKDTFHEPFTLYSWLAALTSKIEFATGILILPQRDVRLVAKQATQLAILSGGRFRLGVGGGWNRAEAESLNSDFSTRGKRMDEQLELLERLFREPLVDFDGEFHQVKRCGINPLPDPIPEIWVGGYADPVLKRVARFGHGWMPATLPAGKEYEILDKLHQYLRLNGKDPNTFGLDARMVLAKFDRKEWTKEYLRWRDLGATHFRVNTMGLGFTRPDEHLKILSFFQKMIEIEG